LRTPIQQSLITILTTLKEIIIGLNKRDPECSDVYHLNILTGELRMIEQNPGNVRQWMVDNEGVVRIAYAEDVLYRKDDKSQFKKLIDNEGEDDAFTIYYFTPDNKNVYAYSNVGRDTFYGIEIYITEESLEYGDILEAMVSTY